MLARRRPWTGLTIATLIAVLAGCADGPRLTPKPGVDLADVEVQLQVGDRIAKPEEYRAKLAEAVPDKDDQAMVDHLLRVSQSLIGAQPVAGNKARPLVDGPATFKAMFEAIDQARHHVHIETFILEDGTIGEELATHLFKARRRGVRVRLLTDAVGSLELPDSFLKELSEAGIEVHKYHPVDPTEGANLIRVNTRNHRKLLVVDGRVAFTGGLNFSGVYSKASLSVGSGVSGASGGDGDGKQADEAWRDTHVRITGPGVAQFQREFLALWNREAEPDQVVKGDDLFPAVPPEGDMLVAAVASDGGDGARADIYSLMLAAIGHARKRLWITQAYFAPDDALVAALQEAADRGVDVRLLLPGVTDSPLVVQASRARYEELLASGVKIYERMGSTLHAKTLVVDGVWASVGSANFDYRSFVYNHELNAMIVSADFGRAMEKLFQVDLQQARAIDLAAWRDRPFTQRVKEQVGNLLREWL